MKRALSITLFLVMLSGCLSTPEPWYKQPFTVEIDMDDGWTLYVADRETVQEQNLLHRGTGNCIGFCSYSAREIWVSYNGDDYSFTECLGHEFVHRYFRDARHKKPCNQPCRWENLGDVLHEMYIEQRGL